MLQNKLKRLPAYLTVQMVRFFYKGKEAVNAKILKVILSCCYCYIVCHCCRLTHRH